MTDRYAYEKDEKQLTSESSANGECTQKIGFKINAESFAAYEGRIDKIEHVTVVVTMKSIVGRRGDQKFLIESPMGTKSMILGTGSHDQNTKGFDKYEFLTMELWDENPIGLWYFHSIVVRNGCTKPTIDGLDIRIRGTGNDQVSSPTTTKPQTTEEPTTTTDIRLSPNVNQRKSHDSKL